MPQFHYDVEQGSEDWFQLRLGLPTASEFHTVLAKGEGKTRSKYMRRLAGEIITGKPAETYTNAHMERGKVMEGEARSLYAFRHDVEPVLVGFIKNGGAGCSPDSLIGDDGMVEFKTALPDIVIEKIIGDRFPAEHVAQCQGNLWIAERDWIDCVIYSPDMVPFEKRAYRDEAYIKNLADEVERFNEDLAAMVARVRRYGSMKDDLKASLEATA